MIGFNFIVVALAVVSAATSLNCNVLGSAGGNSGLLGGSSSSGSGGSSSSSSSGGGGSSGLEGLGALGALVGGASGSTGASNGGSNSGGESAWGYGSLGKGQPMADFLGGMKKWGEGSLVVPTKSQDKTDTKAGGSALAQKHDGFLGMKNPGELVELMLNPLELCARIVKHFKLTFEKFFPHLNKGMTFGLELAVQPMVISLKIFEKIFVPDQCKLKLVCKCAYVMSFSKDLVPTLSDKVLNESRFFRALSDGVHGRDCEAIYQCSGQPKLKEEFKEHNNHNHNHNGASKDQHYKEHQHGEGEHHNHHQGQSQSQSQSQSQHQHQHQQGEEHKNEGHNHGEGNNHEDQNNEGYPAL